ncbi:RNA polymerase sigma factor RpoD/SigA [Nitrospinae bacterium AH_259_B05_G02_I21]|nr:RNA polymerase sigma factor RpoD/SigA [Nitrospinae bacterium AH_259_B05_G02_I21]
MSKGKGQSRSTSDEPLALYLKDLSNLSTLTREEEIDLALRIQKGDKEALRKLVEGNLRFVVSVAAKYSDSRIPLIDLINEGNIGLIKAAEKFNPDKGVKFITYAVWWVVAAIKHALAKQTGVIGLPLKHPNTIYKINRKEEELSKQLGRNPTRDEVAKALGLTRQDIELNLKVARTPLFLDASISDDASVSYLNTIKADFEIDQNLLAKNIRKEIENLIEVLSDREQAIIRMRFGLDDHEPMTLREIGNAMGLSKERIRQIEDRALKQLHKAAMARELEVFLS